MIKLLDEEPTKLEEPIRKDQIKNTIAKFKNNSRVGMGLLENTVKLL